MLYPVPPPPGQEVRHVKENRQHALVGCDLPVRGHDGVRVSWGCRRCWGLCVPAIHRLPGHSEQFTQPIPDFHDFLLYVTPTLDADF